MVCHCYWAKRAGKEFSKALAQTQIGAVHSIPTCECGEMIRSSVITETCRYPCVAEGSTRRGRPMLVLELEVLGSGTVFIPLGNSLAKTFSFVHDKTPRPAVPGASYFCQTYGTR